MNMLKEEINERRNHMELTPHEQRELIIDMLESLLMSPPEMKMTEKDAHVFEQVYNSMRDNSFSIANLPDGNEDEKDFHRYYQWETKVILSPDSYDINNMEMTERTRENCIRAGKTIAEMLDCDNFLRMFNDTATSNVFEYNDYNDLKRLLSDKVDEKRTSYMIANGVIIDKIFGGELPPSEKMEWKRAKKIVTQDREVIFDPEENVLVFYTDDVFAKFYHKPLECSININKDDCREYMFKKRFKTKVINPDQAMLFKKAV